MSDHDDPAHWRARAAEARAMAERLISPDGKQRMHAVAEQFEKLAERAAEKAAAQGRPPLLPESDKG